MDTLLSQDTDIREERGGDSNERDCTVTRASRGFYVASSWKVCEVSNTSHPPWSSERRGPCTWSHRKHPVGPVLCALRWQRGGPVATRSTEACVVLISHLGFPANVDRGTEERLDCEVLVGFLCVNHGTAQRRGTERLVRGHDSGRKASS